MFYNLVGCWQRYDDVNAKSHIITSEIWKSDIIIVKYFTLDDIKTVSLKNNSKLMQGM